MIRPKVIGADVVRKKNANRIRALSADGRMGRMVVDLALRGYTLMRANVHTDTRALWASITIDKKRHSANDVEAVVYLNPSARNPRTRARPADYGKYENARGGSHAFFDKTARQLKGTEIVAIRELTRIVVDGTLT